MEIEGKIVAITGAGRGLGAAMAMHFAQNGAAGVCISDIHQQDIDDTLRQIEEAGAKALGLICDVSQESAIQSMIETCEDKLGPIDLFIANAGVGFGDGIPGESGLIGPAWQQTNEQWQTAWSINVMHHIWAARHLVPKMIARGGGYFATVASSAGILAQIGDTSYTVTKHAARSFAESLSIAHGDEGLKVSCICPQYVSTKMAQKVIDAGMGVDNVLTPEEFCGAVTAGLQAEEFFIFPHPQVQDYMQAKAADTNRWIAGMRKLRRGFLAMRDA